MAPQPPIRVSLNIHVDVPLAGLSGEAVDELLALTKRLREIHHEAEQSAEATRLLTEAFRTPKQPGRVCGYCGTPLTRKTYGSGKVESEAVFAKRQHCDKRCARRARVEKASRSPDAHGPVLEDGRTCETCGKVLVRKRRADGKLERLTAFKRRRTCGNECSSVLQRGMKKPGSGRRKKPKPAPEPDPQEQLARPEFRPTSEHEETLPVASAVVAPVVPWSPPELTSPTAMRPAEGTAICPVHGDSLGAFGCPACNAGKKWREAERERPKVVVSASVFSRKAAFE
jgi:hypothetical protein